MFNDNKPTAVVTVVAAAPMVAADVHLINLICMHDKLFAERVEIYRSKFSNKWSEMTYKTLKPM